MPIPRKRLEEVERPLDERILEFLAGRPDDAFSEVEIFAALEGYPLEEAQLLLAMWSKARRIRLIAPYRDTLSGLEEQGLIDRSIPGRSRACYS